MFRRFGENLETSPDRPGGRHRVDGNRVESDVLRKSGFLPSPFGDADCDVCTTSSFCLGIFGRFFHKTRPNGRNFDEATLIVSHFDT